MQTPFKTPINKSKSLALGGGVLLIIIVAIAAAVILASKNNDKPATTNTSSPGTSQVALGEEYTDKKTGFKISPPQDWTIPKQAVPGLIVEFADQTSKQPQPTISAIGSPARASLNQYIKAISENNAKEFTNYKEIGGKKLTVDNAPAAMLEYTATVDGYDLHYSELVAIKKGAFYQVTGTTTEASWVKYSRSINASLKSVKFS
jgi:hypothetical protein